MMSGRRRTVDERIKQRNIANVLAGHQPGWAEEALDMYLLDEDSIKEICRAFGVRSNTFYHAIAHAALFRMLKAQNIDKITDCEDLQTAATWCPFCKKSHVGGDTCMGHHP